MITCVICRSKNHKEILSQENYQLWQCQNCKVVKTIGKLDDGQYQDEKELELQFKNQRKQFEGYAKQFASLLPIKNGRLLDVGCGLGWFVKLAQKKGFDTTGIDNGKACINVGKKRLGVNMKLVSLKDYKSEQKFDIITANHVIEHADDPNKFLRNLKSLLKNDGWVQVSCPNFDSLMLWIFQQRWYGLVPNQHRFQYSSRSLTYLFEKSGFKIKRVIINNLDYNVPGFKGIIFRCLLQIADITNTGDQVTILAKA